MAIVVQKGSVVYAKNSMDADGLRLVKGLQYVVEALGREGLRLTVKVRPLGGDKVSKLMDFHNRFQFSLPKVRE